MTSALGHPFLLFAKAVDGPAETNYPRLIFIISVIGILLILFGIGRLLKGQPESFIDPAIVRNFNKRITSWLAMTTILTSALLFNKITIVVVFFFLSFWALREYITMTPTRRADHRTLF